MEEEKEEQEGDQFQFRCGGKIGDFPSLVVMFRVVEFWWRVRESFGWEGLEVELYLRWCGVRQA